MSIYPEISSATYREYKGKQYFVRKFGLNGIVFEEELVLLPTQKITKDENGIVISTTTIKG